MDGTQAQEGRRGKAVTILLVEDNQADIKITLRAFAQARPRCKIHVVHDGQEALDFIYRNGDYQGKQTPKPDIILLDIKMPKVDGFQVLEKLKQDAAYKSIPVIVLSSSDYQDDVDKSYKIGAASFIRKPIHYEEFVKVVKDFDFDRYLIDGLTKPEGDKP